VSRTVLLAFVCLAAFLLLFPLTLSKPGLPVHLKADEAAYYLMALSLAHDFDLKVEARDVDRAFSEFPFRPIENLILMTDDGWRTVYYGKPYVYSLFASPFAALAGGNGLLCFNMLLTLAMAAMGFLYLRRFNADADAALFALGFTLLSVSFSYTFWLQPEVFNMAAVAACLFFGLPQPEESAARRRLAFAALSGAALALAVYNKPMFGAVGLAPLAAYLVGKRDWKRAGAWLAGAALSVGIVAGVAVAFTGHPSAYLGVRRQGVTLCEPGVMPISPEVTESTGGVAAAQSPTGNAWSWLIRVPEVTFGEVTENVGYFLWGRHTGLLVYTPFAALAIVLFLLHGRRSVERWVLLASLAGVALYFLVFIAWNWQGGGGFVGNRYFINAYPAFLYLVTRVTPRRLIVAGCAVAGLFLGTLLLTPFGAVVPEPTLQAHVRNLPFRLLPYELSLRNVPGYERKTIGALRVQGSKDVFLPRGDEVWLRGGSRVELHLLSPRPLERMSFLLGSGTPENRVAVRLGKAREVVSFSEADEIRRLDLAPGKPYRVRSSRDGTTWVYRLIVTPSTGRIRHWTREYPPSSCPYFIQNPTTAENFYLGATLTYLGSGEGLEADLYNIQWGQSVVPPRVKAGETFTVLTRLFNRSPHPWQADGAARVALAYHWRDAAGKEIVRDGKRTLLTQPVPPGGRVSVEQQVEAPTEPGSYVLELDPVFEYVAWFSEKNGNNVLRVPVQADP
jgi:hypothetical protein